MTGMDLQEYLSLSLIGLAGGVYDAMKNKPVPIPQAGVIVGLIILVAVASIPGNIFDPHLRWLNYDSYQGTFLALIVALAAYIGNVERDVIKKISEHKEAGRLEKAVERKKDLNWLIGLDILLVALGVVFTAQMTVSKECNDCIDWIQELKLFLFPCALGYLAVLHFRQWIKKRFGGNNTLNDAAGIVTDEIRKSSGPVNKVAVELTNLAEKMRTERLKGDEAREVAYLLARALRHVE